MKKCKVRVGADGQREGVLAPPIRLVTHLDNAILASLPLTDSVVILTDEHVAPCCLPSLEKTLAALPVVRLDSIVLPAGEGLKTLETFAEVIAQLVHRGADRHTTLLALGGGALGDLVGFVASTFMRGVPWIYLPTTLLAQVDASIGGKTALNHPVGKNLIGTFYPPAGVVLSMSLLASLPEADFRAGLAEVVKHAVLHSSACLGGLDRHRAAILRRDPTALLAMVRESVDIKRAIVTRDPFEQGERAWLNLGHTLGHAVEVVTDYRISHGVAVSIGMHFAVTLSERYRGLSTSDAAQIRAVLQGFGLPSHPAELGEFPSVEALMSAMCCDKKRRHGQLRYILLEALGQPVICPLKPSEILPVLDDFLRNSPC